MQYKVLLIALTDVNKFNYIVKCYYNLFYYFNIYKMYIHI